jgi:hypothetical protein
MFKMKVICAAKILRYDLGLLIRHLFLIADYN